MKKLGIIILILGVILLIVLICYKVGKAMFKKHEEVIEGGTVRDEILKGYKDEIKSKEITHFTYSHPDYQLECKKEGEELIIRAYGGNKVQRDGSAFRLEYKSKNVDLLKELQEIVDNYQLYEKNGYVHEVAGLPEEFGDTISITYESGEHIYKYSNQHFNVNEEARTKFYELFEKDAKENGYAFTTEGSNQQIYDDATVGFLQGIWRGKHFGDEVVFDIKGTHIKIMINGKVTDDTDYIIIDGAIVRDKIKEGIETPEDYHDYEEFNGCSIIRKKNSFTLTAYFMKESYSTADILKSK